MMPNAPLHYFSICSSFLRSKILNIEVIRRAWPLFVIRNLKNGRSPRNRTVFSPVKSRDFTVKACDLNATRRWS
jgi:hypothetical protein